MTPSSLPYVIRMDDGVALLLLACFLASAYVLGRSRKFLALMAKGFLLHRERTSLFANTTAADVRRLLLLLVQTCVLWGVLLLCVEDGLLPELTRRINPHVLLGLYVGICLVMLLARWLIYSFLSWIYFDETRAALWLESYSTLIYYLGFAAFPLVLLAVYFDLNLSVTIGAGVVLATLAEFLVFFKWLKLFCPHSYGVFPLVLYFCALEIAPYLALHRGVTQLNEYLLTKF